MTARTWYIEHDGTRWKPSYRPAADGVPGRQTLRLSNRRAARLAADHLNGKCRPTACELCKGGL